jgi:hypothetical protein
MPFDMLQFPNDRERDREREMGSHLSVIPKDASVQGTSPSRSGTPIGAAAPVPSWVTNPPIDYAQAERSGVEGWRSGVVCVFFFHPF